MYSSQSVSQSLSSKPSKTRSLASSSLFGSPSSPSGDNETAVIRGMDSEHKTSTHGTEPAFTFSPISTLTSDDELFDNSPEAQIGKGSSLIREDAMDVSRHESASLNPKLRSSVSTPVGHPDSEVAQRSFRSGMSDTSFALSLDSEDSRHSLTVVPKSPLAAEETTESQKEDLDLIGSQFDIPCAQLVTESSPLPGPQEDPILASLAQTFQDDVQLEYDMSRISELESSNDPLLSILESPPARETVSPQLPKTSSAPLSSSTQPSPVHLSESQRRELIRLCSGGVEAEDDLLEHESSGEESEEERMWMSQHDWGDDSLPQQQTLEL